MTNQLIKEAHRQGVKVYFRKLPKHAGLYVKKDKAIYIDSRLTNAQQRSILAHELGHHFYGHDGCQPEGQERKAWEYGAHLLIMATDYAKAEIYTDGSVPAIAEYLDVTAEVVEAYQGFLSRRFTWN